MKKIHLRLHQIVFPIDKKIDSFVPIVAKKLGVHEHQVKKVDIVRRSIDARKKNERPLYSYSVQAVVDAESIPKKLPRNILEFVEYKDIAAEKNAFNFSVKQFENLDEPPVVIGAGPAGLMAGLILAEAGLEPLLYERGDSVENRENKVGDFWLNGNLDTESNVMYGEGGAGLFSDGKLTTRSKDRPRVKKFLQTLVECGADHSILYDAYPHVGSDKLAEIIPKIRNRIIKKGGQVHFNSKLENVIVENNRITAIVVNGETIETSHCVLAVGHSARDIYSMLNENKILLEPKPFAIGVRVEVPQNQVDLTQWGKWAGQAPFNAASFRLTKKGDKNSRACYTFCMCPGGSVISCASSTGMMTTNGMSLSERAGSFANAGFLVPVNPDDFMRNNDVLSGILFQEKIEQKTFNATGETYALAASSLNDFLERKTTPQIFDERSNPRAVPFNINELLPKFVIKTLTVSIPQMLRQLNGVKMQNALLYASETRSSSPVRIVRNKSIQSETAKGLYPVGEGAGYSGGIVSSAIDGIRAAESIISQITID